MRCGGGGPFPPGVRAQNPSRDRPARNGDATPLRRRHSRCATIPAHSRAVDLIPSRGGESVRGTVVAIYAQRARRGTWHLLAVTSSHPAPVRLLSEVSNSWLPHAMPDSLLLRRYDRFEDVAEVLPPDTDHALPFGHLLLASDPMDRGVAVRRPRVAGRLRRRPRRPARTPLRHEPFRSLRRAHARLSHERRGAHPLDGGSGACATVSTQRAICRSTLARRRATRARRHTTRGVLAGSAGAVRVAFMLVLAVSSV